MNEDKYVYEWEIKNEYTINVNENFKIVTITVKKVSREVCA